MGQARGLDRRRGDWQDKQVPGAAIKGCLYSLGLDKQAWGEGDEMV